MAAKLAQGFEREGVMEVSRKWRVLAEQGRAREKRGV
jgi:hypothetical protein